MFRGDWPVCVLWGTPKAWSTCTMCLVGNTPIVAITPNVHSGEAYERIDWGQCVLWGTPLS